MRLRPPLSDLVTVAQGNKSQGNSLSEDTGPNEQLPRSSDHRSWKDLCSDTIRGRTQTIIAGITCTLGLWALDVFILSADNIVIVLHVDVIIITTTSIGTSTNKIALLFYDG